MSKEDILIEYGSILNKIRELEHAELDLKAKDLSYEDVLAIINWLDARGCSIDKSFSQVMSNVVFSLKCIIKDHKDELKKELTKYQISKR